MTSRNARQQKATTCWRRAAPRFQISRGRDASKSQERVAFATTHPVATKRNASSTNDVTNSRRCQCIKSQSGSQRRNGPRCEPTNPKRVRLPSSRKRNPWQLPHPLKNTARHNALRFSGGPNSPANTHQNATTGASRTMEAKPRLAPSKTHQPTKAGRCKRELYPAATSSTVGGGGHDATRCPCQKDHAQKSRAALGIQLAGSETQQQR